MNALCYISFVIYSAFLDSVLDVGSVLWLVLFSGFVEFYFWPVLDKISKLLTGHKEIQVALTHGPRLDSDGNVVMFSIRVSTERCV